MWWSRLKWPFHLYERDVTTSCLLEDGKMSSQQDFMMFWQLFVVFYCGPGHAHVYLSYLCAGASQMKEHTGSCGQCRTVHEGFKPQSPCFLYGINKNFACTGQGERGHNFALLTPQRHVVGVRCCVLTCSFLKWQRFPFNWKPAAITGVLSWQELLWSPKGTGGSHAAIFLTHFHF